MCISISYLNIGPMNEDFSLHASVIQRENYISDDDWNKLQEYISDKSTPLLVLFKKRAEENYLLLESLLKKTKIYYAVKACPNEEILQTFINLGSCFDIASRYELDLVLSLWASCNNISYGNTIKKELDIAYAYEKWVRMFATDSFDDLEKIARVAPGSKVYFRLLTPAFGADWPLSRKFGCEIPLAYKLAIHARDIGLIPHGISFHVGSQQNDMYSWDVALSKAKELYDKLEESGIHLKMLNLWGGLPSHYLKKTDTLEIYIKTIQEFVDYHFEDTQLDIFMEPGRSMVGDIGVIISDVVLVSKKSLSDDDIGKFWGLIETLDEAIKYPIYTEIKWRKSPAILAGPTCDSADILYENYKYLLPDKLKSGDKIYIFSTWAYTQSYSAVEFNGFPPLKAHVI